jgi:hypothetical protein
MGRVVALRAREPEAPLAIWLRACAARECFENAESLN